MNVAYILNSTGLRGGATKAFLNILDGMEQHGVCANVVVPDKNGVYRILKERNIKTFVTPYRPCTYPRSRTWSEKLFFPARLIARVLVNWIACQKLISYIKINEINLVHSNTGVVRIGYDAAIKTGIPHVYHIREYGDLDFGINYFPYKASFLKQLASPLCYSICITKNIQRHFRQQDKRTSLVIYDGVFPYKSDFPQTITDKGYFLYAGRIEPAKGLEQLLHAYKTYVQRTGAPLHLKVAGSVNDISYYNQQLSYIKKHRLSQYVHFLGECDPITTLMHDARAIVIPSLNEGFGFCMPEAMQQGCLAVGHNTGGTKEQFDNGLELTGGEIGLRYDTTEELVKILQDVTVTPPENYLPYKERAFRTINQLYTSENNAQLIYNFYNDILNEKNSISDSK